MEIRKDQKIEAVCAKSGDARYALTEPWLEGDRLIATNAHTLVSIPIERAGVDIDGAIPIAALRLARQGGKHSPAIVTAPNGHVAASGRDNLEQTFQRCEDKTFPNVERLVDSCLASAVEYEISLDAKLLAATAAAIGSEKVTLKFRGVSTAVEVLPGAKDRGTEFGILMPCNI